MTYNQAQSGNYATGPVTVDGNGVPVAAEAIGQQTASPPSSIATISPGLVVQLLPTSPVIREVTLTNIGFVPVYISNTDPGPQSIQTLGFPNTGNSPFTPTGSKLAPGERVQVKTSLAVYATTRPIGGVAMVGIST